MFPIDFKFQMLEIYNHGKKGNGERLQNAYKTQESI